MRLAAAGLRNFFTVMCATALERAAIITAVRLPKPQAACYQTFRNPASRYAIVGVFVARTPGGVRVVGDGCRTLRLPSPEKEAALARSFTPDAIKDITIPQDGLNSDVHAAPNTAPFSSASWPPRRHRLGATPINFFLKSGRSILRGGLRPKAY